MGEPRAPRDVGRRLALLGLLGLGAAGLGRVALRGGLAWPADASRAPHALRVELALPEPLAPAEVGPRFLAAVERAARTVPGVEAVRGEARPGGGTVRVGLAAAGDVEGAAEALDAALATARARLPAAARLEVAVDEPPAPVALQLFFDGRWDPEAVRRRADALALVPGVHDVALAAPEIATLDVALRNDDAAAAREARAVVLAALAPPAVAPGGASAWILTADGGLAAGLGESPPAGALARALGRAPVPVADGAVPLASLADFAPAHSPPVALTRFDRRPGSIVTVSRSRDTPPFVLAGRLDRALALAVTSDASPPRRLIDEGARWRRLGERLLVAFLLAAAVCGTCAAGARDGGGRTRDVLRGSAEALLAGAAAGLGALAVASGLGLPLTPDLVGMGAFAVLAVLPWRLARRDPGATAADLGLLLVVTAGTLALVLALGGALADRLAHPLGGALAGAAAAAAVVLLERRLRGAAALAPPCGLARALGALQRRAARDPMAVALAAAAGLGPALLLLGGALRPVAGTRPATARDATVHLDLPATATLDEGDAHARLLEAALGPIAGVEHTEAVLSPGAVDVHLWLAPSSRRGLENQRLLARVRRRLPVGELLAGGASDALPLGVLLDALPEEGTEREPFSPWTAESYRATLRAASGEALEQAFLALRRALATYTRSATLHPAWGALASRLVVEPPAVASGGPTAGALAAALRGITVPAAPLARFPRFDLRLLAPQTPRSAAALPQRTAVLGRALWVDGTAVGSTQPAGTAGTPLLWSSLATARLDDELVPTRLVLGDGVFELPFSIDVPGATERARRIVRAAIDAQVASLPVAGVTVERPALGRFATAPRERRSARAAAILAGGVLLAVLLAAGAPRVPRAALARLPLAALAIATGLAFAAVDLGGAGARLDPSSLVPLVLALATGLAAARTPLAVAARSAPARAAARSNLGLGLVAARRRPFALALGGSALGLWVAMAGSGRADDLFALPLRTGAVAALGAALAATLLVPALATSAARRRAAQVALRARAAAAWSEALPPRLEARLLTKTYATGLRALDRVSFTLDPGVTGLLGPNGAGKTTLLRLLVGLLEPTRGTLRWNGVALAPGTLDLYRRHLGFLPQDFNAYPGFSGAAFLRHWARTRELRLAAGEIERLLSAVGLAAHADRRVRDYSGGMRRRLGIAVALLGAPPLLIVDEPTTGLDLPSRQQLREILLRSAGERIVLLSTHIASDVEAVASRLLVLRRGRLVYDGGVEGLLARAAGRVHELVVGDDALLDLGRRMRVTRRVRELGGIRVRVVRAPEAPPPGPAVAPNLEEAYLAVMQE